MRARCTSLFTAILFTSGCLPTAAFGQPASGDPPKIDERYRALETFAKGVFYLGSMYVDPEKVGQDKMVNHALGGIVEKLDPHTVIMPKEAFKRLTTDTQGKFGGIGIVVTQDDTKGTLTVLTPIEDTPAAEAGILAGDEITAIDGKPVRSMKRSESVERMRGPPGSTITLTIRRDGRSEPLEFTLTRRVIKVKSVRSHTLASGITYVRIASFQEETAEELLKILSGLQRPVRGFILDLRDNPGGLLDQAVRVSDAFITSGLIVSTVGRDPSRIEREFAHTRGTYIGFPIVVLVNGGSASASEIVAGALQDHDRALVLGTTTFGKGSVQTLVSLPDGSGLKLTVARYYTPKDRSIQARGIVPDIHVPARRADIRNRSRKKEADLERHIESDDLSDLAQSQRLLGPVAKWPKAMRDDYQLVTAFKYLKGWTIFQRRNR